MKTIAAGILFVLLILLLGVAIGRRTVEVRVLKVPVNMECSDGVEPGKVFCAIAESR